MCVVPRNLDTPYHRMARDGATRVGADLGDLRAPTVTAARHPVVPLHGTRWFRGGLKSLIMPDACRNQTERQGWCPCRRRSTPVTGWLAAWTHDPLA